jgi:hypothetical protein
MDSDAYKQLISFHEKLMQLQLFARQNSDDVDTIASLSKTLFSTEYENAVGLDLDIYDILQELKEYAEPLSVLLNELPILSKQDEGTPIPENLEAEIRSYIASKGL